MPKTECSVTPEYLVESLYDAVNSGKIKNEYAKTYIIRGIPQCQDAHELAVQFLYILNNLQGWRGEDARQLKADIKTYCKSMRVM